MREVQLNGIEEIPVGVARELRPTLAVSYPPVNVID